MNTSIIHLHSIFLFFNYVKGFYKNKLFEYLLLQIKRTKQLGLFFDKQLVRYFLQEK